MAVQQAALQLILERKSFVHELPKNCIFIAAGNIEETEDGVETRLRPELLNRFKHYYVSPDFVSWRSWALENGVTDGATDTTFDPNGYCTRGQIVTFLHRAVGKPAPASSRHPFTDIQSDQYYYNAVLWAVENDVTSGTSDTTFSPGVACTRGQAVTFLYRVFS